MKNAEKLREEILDTARRIAQCDREMESQKKVRLQYASWKRALEWALEDAD